MKYTIALAGNPNSGKTTLFNALTGANAHVGNWPGVTVERKEGRLKADKEAHVVDLPGIYSLSPYTMEEVIAREYLISAQADVILNIIDTSNLERNLYLTSQLLEIGLPVVVAANMMDIVKKRQDTFDAKKLSKELGVPVIEISALRSQNLDQLIAACRQQAEAGKKPSFSLTYPEKIEKEIQAIQAEQASYVAKDQAALPSKKVADRWLAIKVFEQDEKILEAIDVPKSRLESIEGVEDAFDEDAQSLISSARYDFISTIIHQVYQIHDKEALSLTDRIDRIVTNRVLALPIFVAIIFFVYWLSISTIGTQGTDFVNDVVVEEWAKGGAASLLESAGASEWVTGLLVEGIIGGVGAVLGFLPQMAVLFLCLAILEQCGYMARIAFILDRIFRKFGLSGKSFIPMLIGTGCSVPAIMASRTIENENDRRMTAITTSFMPCSAKLPIISFIVGAIMGGAWWYAPMCYFIGIASVIFSGIVLKKTRRFAGDPAPFVMELPEYHLPTIKGVLRSVGERCAAFARKAGTIILLSAIVLWFLQAYGITSEGIVAVGEDVDQSILASIGNAVAWIFSPLGFGDWQSTVATVTGLIAKENVMTTFAVIFGVSGDALELIEEGDWSSLQTITAHYTTISATSFLIFQLLCAPCFAAVGAMHRELGSAGWTLFGVGYQTIFAYSVCLVFFQFATVLTGGPFTVWTILAALVFAIWMYLLFRKDKTGFQGELLGNPSEA